MRRSGAHILTFAACCALTAAATAQSPQRRPQRDIVLTITAPAGRGSLSVDVSGGTPGALFVTLVALEPRTFPHGPLFGLELPMEEILTQWTLGPPFIGVFDARGRASWGGATGLPAGMRVYAVTLESPDMPFLPRASTPVVYVVP
ncbi:MAG TPA: hypothetical protein VEI02_09640 [Planctomycetota bacterium]|nr:hypothetical protein [Planctomycetota bacterium]